jgi:YggT family protein
MAAVIFVLHTLFSLLAAVFLLRIAMPLVRADFRNPIGQAVLQVTNPLVMPLRRLLPPVGRVDVASIAALLLVQLAGTALIRLAAGAGLAPVPLVAGALVGLARTILQLYFWLVLVHVLLSWVAPGQYGAGIQLVHRLCEPLLRPVRRVIPPLGAFDLSPMFVLIGLQALQLLLP